MKTDAAHRSLHARSRHAALTLALTFTLALAACGGGGSDGATASGPGAALASGAGSATPADTGATIAVGRDTASAASAKTSTDTTCGNPQLRAQLIAGINALRASAQSCGSKGSFGAAGPLTWNAVLFDAAAGHSADMAARNYFSHTSPEGLTLQNRVVAVGYEWTAVAENIAAGQTSVTAVLSAWMASPGHCVNIMGATYREVALSCARSESGTRYWTLNLGRP